MPSTVTQLLQCKRTASGLNTEACHHAPPPMHVDSRGFRPLSSHLIVSNPKPHPYQAQVKQAPKLKVLPWCACRLPTAKAPLGTTRRWAMIGTVWTVTASPGPAEAARRSRPSTFPRQVRVGGVHVVNACVHERQVPQQYIAHTYTAFLHQMRLPVRC